MMIQIDHRESRDVDLFLPDGQYLGLLDPTKRDFEFEIAPDGVTGDGTASLKFAFTGIGEIDFIVAPALTTNATTMRSVEGRDVALETVPEIITKKVHYRGRSITPRDIFDIAAAAQTNHDELINALKGRRNDVAATIKAIERLNPDFVSSTISALAIRDDFQAVAGQALTRATTLLRSV